MINVQKFCSATGLGLSAFCLLFSMCEKLQKDTKNCEVTGFVWSWGGGRREKWRKTCEGWGWCTKIWPMKSWPLRKRQIFKDASSECPYRRCIAASADTAGWTAEPSPTRARITSCIIGVGGVERCVGEHLAPSMVEWLKQFSSSKLAVNAGMVDKGGGLPNLRATP